MKVHTEPSKPSPPTPRAASFARALAPDGLAARARDVGLRSDATRKAGREPARDPASAVLKRAEGAGVAAPPREPLQAGPRRAARDPVVLRPRPVSPRQAPVGQTRGRELSTRAAGHLDLSRAFDSRLAQAHGRAAETALAGQHERVEDRVRTSLFQEIDRQCLDSAEDEPTRPDAPGMAGLEAALAPTPLEAPPTPTAAAASTSGPRAEAIASLVARIEASLKDGQPALKLGLSDRLGAASIEITRTGRGEVAVRIAARPGRRASVAAASGAIAQALRARGLKVRDLEVT